MTYIDPDLRGQGASTASQTAWVLQGLIAAGEAAGPRVQAGVSYLLERQNAAGEWDEPEYTGTGFPRLLPALRSLSDLFSAARAGEVCNRSRINNSRTQNIVDFLTHNDRINHK